MTKRTPLSNKRTTLPNGRTKLTYTRYSSSDDRGGAVDQTGPQWKSESWDITWTTGDTINYDVRQHLEPGNDILHYTFERTSGTFPLDLDMNNGIITGVISAIQGGTYALEVKATNPLDNSTSLDTLSILLVGLEVTDPTFSAVSDQLNIEVGAFFSLPLSTYLTDDGDPASVSAITYILSSGTFPAGITVSSIGVVEGTVTEIVSSNLITVAATNASGFSTDITFNISAINSAVTAPTMNGLWSGEVGCGLAVPTWGILPDFDLIEGEETTYNLSSYIESNGGAAISGYSINSGTLPSGVTGPSASGVLTADGTQLTSSNAMTYIAANSEGNSSPSDSMNVVVTAVAQPTITSIIASDGSDEVTVYFDEEQTNAGNYNAGFAYKINNVSKTFVYKSGGLTAAITYTSEDVLYGNNSIELIYDDTTGTLKGVTSGEELDDYTNVGSLYVVPAGGVIFSDGFELGNMSKTENGFAWVTGNGTPTSVSSERAYSGTYSLKFPFFVSDGPQPEPWSEHRFVLGGNYPEIYIQFQLYVPTNYSHVLINNDDNNTNHKFCRLWDGSYDLNYEKMGCQLWSLKTNTDGDAAISMDHRINGSSTQPFSYTPYIDKSVDGGKWMEVKLHFKMESSDGANDGLIEIWKNGNFWDSRTGLGNWHSGYNHYFSKGYLLGSATAAILEDFDMFIDEFVISTNDIT